MPIKKMIVSFVLLLLLSIALPTQAIGGLAADLYYIAPDSAGVYQVWQVGSSNAVTQLTTETNPVIGYDVAYNSNLAYVTPRSLSLGGIIVTSGGPLDSQALSLIDVAWAPSATQAAVVALSMEGAADPSEGVWLYDIISQSWTLLLTSSSADPANTLIYTGVRWAASGDRLVLDVEFSAEVSGTAVYSLSTGKNQVYNQNGTNNIIDPNGYGRGSISLDGAFIILSDVPNSPTGAGFVVDANNFSRIVQLDDPGARYLSHATPILNGTAYFIRDFGNNIPTSEVWQLSIDGARVALGSIPDADLAYFVDWTEDGTGLVYMDEYDESTGLGVPHVFNRVGAAMEAVPLPPEVSRVAVPSWGPLRNTPNDRVYTLTMTEPVADYQDESGAPFYTLRVQWNAVEGGNGNYRATIEPGFEGQNTFDVAGIAMKLNHLPCDITLTISIAHYDAGGVPGAESVAHTITTPPCDAPLFPVIRDIYSGVAAPPPPPPPADTTAPVPVEPTTTTEEAVEPAAEPIGEAPAIPPGTDQGGAATVQGVTASAPVQEGTRADGSALYVLDLTWSQPQQPVKFFLVQVFPPFGENQRNVVAVRSGEDSTVSTQLSGLLCGVDYTLTVQSIADDGITVLSNADPLQVATPFCQ